MRLIQATAPVICNCKSIQTCEIIVYFPKAMMTYTNAATSGSASAGSASVQQSEVSEQQMEIDKKLIFK